MTTTLYYVLAAFVGVVAAVYLPMNGRFGAQVGSPLLATTVFFCVGATAALICWLALGKGDALTLLARADVPLFSLGIISFGIILSATFLIPKVGPGAYFVCIVAGQVVAGLALSHYGILSPERLPMTPLKFVGALAIIAGVICIRIAEMRPADSVPQSAEVGRNMTGITDNQPRS